MPAELVRFIPATVLLMFVRSVAVFLSRAAPDTIS